MDLKVCLKFPLGQRGREGILEKGNDMSKTKQQIVEKVEGGCENKPNMGFKHTYFVMEEILLENKVLPVFSYIKWE